MDVFKRSIKKANEFRTENVEIKELLLIYRITPNQNTNANMSPVELMIARKIRLIFEKLIPSEKGNKKKINISYKTYIQGKNIS